MKRYFLGVDAGATKSQAVIADETGQVLGLGNSGSGNPDWVGQDGFAAAMEQALQESLAQAEIDRSAIAGAGFGVAGYDWPSQRADMLASIDKLNLTCPVELVNDSLIALVAGASQGWGVAVIAGTSCNAWGLSQDGRYGRMAGFSRLGENAGSHEIAEKALQEVTKAWSQRGPKTQLTQAFIERVGAKNEDDLIEGISLRKYEIGHPDAPLVFDVAKAGDSVAQGLVKWAGAELGDLALGIIRQLDLFEQSFEIVLSGSFYKGSPILQAEMARVVHEHASGARFVALQAPSVIGGVLFGMQAAGFSLEQRAMARQRLAGSYGDLFAKEHNRESIIV